MTATRNDVARLAGVSPALVSYVINGGPRPVSKEARDRINKAIRELDYRPNAVARALRGASTRTVALLSSSPTNPFLAELAEALESRLYDAGMILTIAISENDEERERDHFRAFVDRRFDGIILISSRAVASQKAIGATSIPTVVLDRVPSPSTASSVHVDNYLAARAAVGHLADHGYPPIRLVCGPADAPVSVDRERGWRDELEARGLQPRQEMVSHSPYSARGGYEAAMAAFSKAGPDRPRALFVCSDAQALGVLHACFEQGLTVPTEVAIVAFDGTSIGDMANPALTSMVQPVDEIAEACLAVFEKKMSDPDALASETILDSRLHVGYSCGCRG